MFTTLYNNILPAIGDFFGRLTAIANCPSNVILNAVSRAEGFSLNFTNYFTGVSSSFSLWNQSAASGFIRAWFILPAETAKLCLNVFNIPTSAPLWLCLLLFTGVCATIMSLVRMISKAFL